MVTESFMKLKEVGTNLVVYLAGHIDLNLAADVEAELDDVIAKYPEKNLILNLEAVHYMSSSGLRVFMTVSRTLERSRRGLRLCNLSAPVKKVVHVVGLEEHFKIFESEELALGN